MLKKEGISLTVGRFKEIKFKCEIYVEPDGDGYHAYCPALKGLHSDGDTVREALKNAEDAAGAYLKSMIRHGDAIPVGIIGV